MMILESFPFGGSSAVWVNSNPEATLGVEEEEEAERLG